MKKKPSPKAVLRQAYLYPQVSLIREDLISNIEIPEDVANEIKVAIKKHKVHGTIIRDEGAKLYCWQKT